MASEVDKVFYNTAQGRECLGQGLMHQGPSSWWRAMTGRKTLRVLYFIVIELRISSGEDIASFPPGDLLKLIVNQARPASSRHSHRQRPKTKCSTKKKRHSRVASDFSDVCEKPLMISSVLELSSIWAENSAHISNDLFADYGLQNIRVIQWTPLNTLGIPAVYYPISILGSNMHYSQRCVCSDLTEGVSWAHWQGQNWIPFHIFYLWTFWQWA